MLEKREAFAVWTTTNTIISHHCLHEESPLSWLGVSFLFNFESSLNSDITTNPWAHLHSVLTSLNKVCIVCPISCLTTRFFRFCYLPSKVSKWYVCQFNRDFMKTLFSCLNHTVRWHKGLIRLKPWNNIKLSDVCQYAVGEITIWSSAEFLSLMTYEEMFGGSHIKVMAWPC